MRRAGGMRGVRRTRGGPEGRQLGGRGRCRGRPQRRARRRPADLPRADRGRRRGVGRRPPRAARARQDARGAPGVTGARGRCRDHDLLGRRLGPGRRRGRAARRLVACVRAGDVRRVARAAPRGGHAGEPARLYGDDLGRHGGAVRTRAGGRRGSGRRPRARVLRPVSGPGRRDQGVMGRRPRRGDRRRRGERGRHDRLLDAARAARRRRRLAVHPGRHPRRRRPAHRPSLRRRAGTRARRFGAAARDRRPGADRQRPRPPPSGWPSTTPRSCCGAPA